MSATGDPKSAQKHARAMAGAKVESMPTLPASACANPPPGVDPASLVWEETIEAGGYAHKQLARGARLRLEDLKGDAHVSLLIFNAERPIERFNVADTLKVQWNAYLGAGKLLLSDMGRVMMSILEDNAPAYDPFCGASNETSNARKYGEGGNHSPFPNARDRFLIMMGKYGLGRKDVHPCLNIFKPVRVVEDGAVLLNHGPFPAGRAITLRAEMDVIVALANCPHVLDPRGVYSVTPLRATAWRDAITPEEDHIRNATPEGLRAFQNSEAYYAR